MSFLLRGVALVTGAGSGIGRAACKLYARDGIAGLTIADINEDGLRETQREVRSIAPNLEILSVVVDVQEQRSVGNMVARAIEKFGALNYALNVAGTPGGSIATADASLAQYDKTMAINARGVFLCMQHELSAMKLQEKYSPPESNASVHPPERGTIVNVASLAGLGGVGGMAAYVSSKHAVVGMTKTAAIEYARDGIRVNSVCPGFIHTPMLEDFFEKRGGEREVLMKGMCATNPSGRLGFAEEIASACGFLSGPLSTYVNGVNLAVDGGTMAATSFFKPV